MLALGICGFSLNAAAISNLIALSMCAPLVKRDMNSIPPDYNCSWINLVSHSKEEDLATAISSLHLFRSLGTSICLTLTAAEVQNVLRSELRLQLIDWDSDFVEDIIKRITRSLGNIEDLGQELEKVVRGAYEAAIVRSLLVCFWFAALALVASLAIREKKKVGATKT